MHELKQRLSALVGEASSGNRVLITKHGRPVAALSAATEDHVHVGKAIGNLALKPLFHRETDGRYLEALATDRRERELPVYREEG